MAANVAGISCDRVDEVGADRTKKSRLVFGYAPGYSGVWIQNVGTHESFLEFRARKFDTQANVEAWMASMEAKQGASNVTIEIDDGEQFTGLSLLAVGRHATRRRKYALRDPANPTYTHGGEIFVQAIKVE